MKTYQSFSSEKTKELGEKFAKEMAGKVGREKSAKSGKGAIVFALRGDLGAGKTTFAQGFLKGLGVKRRAPSPTFVIMRRYGLPSVPHGSRGTVRGARAARAGRLANLFHVDAYRLKSAKHLAALDFEKVLADPRSIVLIEWAERVKNILPKGTVWLAFRHGKRENERHITIKR